MRHDFYSEDIIRHEENFMGVKPWLWSYASDRIHHNRYLLKVQKD